MDFHDHNLTLLYTTPNTDWDYDYQSRMIEIDILQKISVTLYSIPFVLGIIGNGLVIWIAGFRMKKTVNAVWFLNLAIADFLCCASLPLRIAQWFDYFQSYLGMNQIHCLLTFILFSINMSASVLLLTAMSIDRCVSVMWPFWAKVHRTHRLVRITAGVIWVLGFFLTGLVFVIFGSYNADASEWCVAFWIQTYFDHVIEIVQMIRLVTMFVIPFLIILTSYVIIFFKLRKSKRPQRSQRPYRIITAVILCFFICWCPYYIWLLTYIHIRGFLRFHTVNTIIINLACINSCINPIIYVFMGQDFRQGFFRSIPGRLKRALSEQPDDLSKEPDDGEHACTTDV